MTDSALGVTVTDPLARTNARVAAAEAGSSLSKVFDSKMPTTGSGISTNCHLQRRLYVACTRLMLEQLKCLGAAVGRHRGFDEMMATRQLSQRLSLTLMCGNAALRLADGQIMTLLKQL